MIVIALDGGRYTLRDGHWSGPQKRTLAFLEGTRDLWGLDEYTGVGALPTQDDRDRAWARWLVQEFKAELVHEDPPPELGDAPRGVVF